MIIPSLPFHKALVGCYQYFRQCRNNLFAGASDSELRRIMAPSIAPRPAYLRINPLNNHRNIGVCDWLSPAQVGFVAHESAPPRAKSHFATILTNKLTRRESLSRIK